MLLDRGHDIGAVATSNSDVRVWASRKNLKLVSTDETIDAGLRDIRHDWLFSIANLRMLPSHVWQAASKGAANFHDGPLPRHAGLNAPAWAILAGDTQYGVTWHAITQRADEGEIYSQATFDLADDETSLTLNMKCFEAGLASFGGLLDRIETGSLAGVAQDLSRRSYHARDARPSGLATLQFDRSTNDIHRLARAMAFGDRYANPLCLPKLRIGSGAYNVRSIEPEELVALTAPGTVITADAESAVIATADGAVRIKDLTDETGAALPIERALRKGDNLPIPTSSDMHRLDDIAAALSHNEPFFHRRLQSFVDLQIDGVHAGNDKLQPRWQTLTFKSPATLSGERAVAALIGGLARISGQGRFDIFFADDRVPHPHAGYIASTTPLQVTISDGATADDLAAAVTGEISELTRRTGYAADLASRYPDLGVLRSTVAVRLAGKAASPRPFAGSAVTFAIPDTGSDVACIFDENRLSAETARALLQCLLISSEHFSAFPDSLVSSLPLISDDDREDLLFRRNDTKRDYDRDALVHQLFEKRAEISPDAVAIVSGGRSLTYRELNSQSDRVAEYLVSLGVTADALVGLNLGRSCDLVVGALAILKAGGAYVPLDPTYPADRIEYMIKDSGLSVLLVDPGVQPATAPGIKVCTVAAALDAVKTARPSVPRSASNNLAYVIYTSGSTGQPKGVMIEHRNVVNFFVGMDERIARPAGEQQPVWLAVTSLSFDISVLEIFWTLARGFKVVVLADETDHTKAGSAGAATKDIDFGLFYWGDDDQPGSRKYQLLLEGARFADKHGFTAIWTPERHFHAFGGPYPNPAVTGAAIAAVTQNLSVRAGSCVLPLHHPARVAEDWAVVDNLSDGRVALAFASGWMPEDFVLRPENAPPENKKAMFRDVEIVRKLWRGEKVAFPAAGEKTIEITTLPRPVQKELPVWITTAGNPETFREAARHGANVLTHLLGQSVAEVSTKISAYRDELRKHGRDPSAYKVTLMLHTLVGHDREIVREQAREPMKRYLKSAAALIKDYAWAFPAFKKPIGVSRSADLDLKNLSAEEMDAVVEFAFLRYFDDSGLFGTVDDAVRRVEQLRAIGVDEIACLVDFGVANEVALEGLRPLADVVAACKSQSKTEGRANAVIANEDEPGIGALIRRHDVTHLQCTPAMATMLLENDDDRNALNIVKHFFIGGEALQASLLNKLRAVTKASVENMYGPTETTIWSSTGPANITEGTVPLGTPIANTQLYVLDSRLRPVPRCFAGELVIGGDGVARGYLKRPELTKERFVDNPAIPGAKMYRTGDLVRIDDDDALHFIGRSDNQVKVRGYRIELGEIENCIGSCPGVGQTVVIVRQDVPGDARIVAYTRFTGDVVSDETLRDHIRRSLPDFMVPSHFVTIDDFPLTPNLKIDRKALPKPGLATQSDATKPYEAPASELEKQIANVFQRVLGIPRVGLNDNFFGLGGHSLLAVQAHRDLKREQTTSTLSITDLYRFPTVSGLVNHLRNAGESNKHLDRIAARAAERRANLASRRALGQA